MLRKVGGRKLVEYRWSKMVKVKGDKFLGTDEKGNRWQIFRDRGNNILLLVLNDMWV